MPKHSAGRGLGRGRTGPDANSTDPDANSADPDANSAGPDANSFGPDDCGCDHSSYDDTASAGGRRHRFRPSRRGVLAGAGALGLGSAAAAYLPAQVAFGDTPGRTLVVLALRGGMDGLNALVPASDANYATLRANLAIPAAQLIPVDRTFGLHPAYASLRPLLTAGRFAAVPAAGLVGNSRSHFKDTYDVEVGSSSVTTGFLTRLLSVLSPGSTFRALQEGGSGLPYSFGSSTEALSVTGLDRFKPSGWGDAASEARTVAAMNALYSDAGPVYARGVSTTLRALDEAKRYAAVPYTPGGGAVYGNDALNQALSDIARLVRAGSGVRIATLETSGYDTHVGQGGVTGTLATVQKRFSDAVAAFFTDLGDKAADVTLVTIQEFGRRAMTNGQGGTDHGRGGVMFVIGGGAVGGVHGTWTGLAPAALDNGDVPVNNDYRNVLGDVMRWLGASQASLSTVFPELRYAPLGVARV